jgi:hypothetical protein
MRKVIDALGLDGARLAGVPLATVTAAFASYVEQSLVSELPAGDVVAWKRLAPQAAAFERAKSRMMRLPPY